MQTQVDCLELFLKGCKNVCLSQTLSRLSKKAKNYDDVSAGSLFLFSGYNLNGRSETLQPRNCRVKTTQI